MEVVPGSFFSPPNSLLIKFFFLKHMMNIRQERSCLNSSELVAC